MTPPTASRNESNSPDWKYLAQQLAQIHLESHGVRDANNKRTNECGHPACVAAIEAIRRASDYGHEAF